MIFWRNRADLSSVAGGRLCIDTSNRPDARITKADRISGWQDALPAAIANPCGVCDWKYVPLQWTVTPLLLEHSSPGNLNIIREFRVVIPSRRAAIKAGFDMPLVDQFSRRSGLP
jgi:hypothetical protein